MYAPIAAAAAVAAHGHRQSYPAVPRPSRFDEVARRSSSNNFPGPEAGFYQHSGATQQSASAAAYHHQQQQQQQQHPAAAGHVHGGAYWAPPQAPRLTAAAPRAAWPHDFHSYGAARVDPWGRYPVTGSNAALANSVHSQQAHWGAGHGGAAGQHAAAGPFPPYAQPHQQLEHQLLLHHYLSKLQTHYDHSAHQHAQAYQHQEQQQQQQYQQQQQTQQYYSGQRLQGYPQPSQSLAGQHRQWPQYGQAHAARQPSLVAPDQPSVPTHDWSSHVARLQPPRAGYTNNWSHGAGSGAEWSGAQEWGAGSEHHQRGHTATTHGHERAAHESATQWAQPMQQHHQETRHSSLGWSRKDGAEAGYPYSAARHEPLMPPAQTLRAPQQPHQVNQPHQRDEYSSGNDWRAGPIDARASMPTFAVVSPAPPPSPTGLPPAADERAAGATGTAPSAPAPPSPATIDKSSVPIYEIGVELVTAVCRSVLGSVVRSSTRASASAIPSRPPPAAAPLANPARSRHSLQTRSARAVSGYATGLGVYETGAGGVRNADDVLASQLAASGSNGSGELLTHSNSSMGGASRFAHILTNSTEAISSGDSSEGSSEPGTPASSVSDVDEFYPKPMSISPSESAPPQLRSAALNLSLDQSGIWQPKSQGGANGGWATASPACMPARPLTARKSDSHSERPLALSQALAANKSVSYHSTPAHPQDGFSLMDSTLVGDERADTSAGSSLVADGPLGLMSPSWPWTTHPDDFYSLPVCHGRAEPQKAFAMMEDAYVFRSHLEASGASSPTMNTDIKAAFAHFAHQVLSQTLLSPTAFMLGLLYILRVPSLVLDADGAVKDEARALFAEPPSAAPFKLFTLGMMIANKQLDDNTFTNRTWKEVTGIPLADLNRLERFYLERCHFEINVPPEVWYAFLGRLRDREVERRAHVARTATASPLSPPSLKGGAGVGATAAASSTFSGFDAVVTSECSRRVSSILKTLLNGGEESISPLLGSVGEPALALAADLGVSLGRSELDAELDGGHLRGGPEGLNVFEDDDEQEEVEDEDEDMYHKPHHLQLHPQAQARYSYGGAEARVSYPAARAYSGGSSEDPRFSAPAHHAEADVFDDDSGPFRMRTYRPRSAAAVPGGPGSFAAAQLDFTRSRSDPAALCA